MLTKLNPKESFTTIQERHKVIRKCDWLKSKETLLEVLNNPWVPRHEAQTYMQTAEPLTDFKLLLESGINQLKTEINPLQTANIITFCDELSSLYNPVVPDVNKTPYKHSNNDNLNLIPIFTIQNEKDHTLGEQIHEIYDNQRKLGRNVLARNGIYYIFGLVNFFAHKWLGKLKIRNFNKAQAQTINQLALPTKLSDDIAENSIYTIKTQDHVTQRNSFLIGSLLAYLSKTYLTLQQRANTVHYTDLKLDEILFYGKLVVHSNLFSEYPYERVSHYKNYQVTRNNVSYHLLLSRPQKILRAGSIEELGRAILYPLYLSSGFSTKVLEEFHQM